MFLCFSFIVYCKSKGVIEMKKILVINPVATDEWNVSDKNYFEKIISKDTLVEVVNIEKGPAYIESFYDESFAVPDILRIVKEKKNFYDGIMINCFADPGVYAAREVCDIPVVGPGESAMLTAVLLGHKFSIVSVKKNVVPIFEMKARLLGITGRLASVEFIDISVNNLEKNRDEAVKRIVAAADKAVKEKYAEVIILGCTGMLSLYTQVREEIIVPVVEPAATAVKLLEKLIELRLSHNKTGLYTYPVFEKIKGY